MSTINHGPETGSFNHRALMSGRRFDPTAVLRTDQSIHGLQPEAGYIWGTLRDDEGGIYTIMRRVPPRGPAVDHGDGKHSLGGKLLLTRSGHGADQLELRREPRYAVHSDDIVIERGTDAAVLGASENEHGKSMTLRLSEDDFRYNETDVIDVTGTMAATPLQWFLPGRDESLLYLTQTWRVEGELIGKRVRGFLFWEEAWMREGARLYIDRDPLLSAEYLTWYSWANEWPDGCIEVGHFLYGNDGFHVAVRSDNAGTVHVGQTMEAVVNRDPDGYWHAGIDYIIDGEKWRCDPEPHGRMSGLGKIPNPQQEGYIHRVGESRTPTTWMAWGESVPANGEVRRW